MRNIILFLVCGRLQNGTNPGDKTERTRSGSKGCKSALKKHVSNSELHSFAIERGRFVDDECTQPTAPYAFKRDNALGYVALLVSAFTEETTPSSPPGCRSPRRCPSFSSASRLVRGPTVKYGSDEAEQWISDNAGCDGAYYRTECVSRSIIRGIRFRSIAHAPRSSASITFRSLSLFPPALCSLYPFSVCLLTRVMRYDNFICDLRFYTYAIARRSSRFFTIGFRRIFLEI